MRCIARPDPARPVRVTFLGHAARLSGAEIGLLRFVQASAGQVDATVILAEDGPLVAPLREAGAAVEVLPLAEQARSLKRAQVRPGRDQAAAALEVARYVGRLRRRLRALAPDLVHTNSLKAGVYGTPAARAAGRPVVWHLHDRLARDYLPAHVVPAIRAMAAVLPSAVVAPSQMALDTVGPRLRPGVRRAVVPFPIPIPGQPLEVRDAVRRIGIVGRITPWKGQHVFLEAFARAFPDGDVTAVVIGSAMFGETSYEAQLHALARRLGIEDRVEFAGFREDVPGELARLDVLVHASVLADPLTTVVLEGMAAGIPVVSADAGGHAEHVTDGVDGLLHPPGDVAALAAALRRIAGDASLRRAMAAAGRSRAEDFAPPAVTGRMLELYRSLL